MAVNKIWAVKSDFGCTINYIENDDKTIDATIRLSDGTVLKDIENVIDYATQTRKTLQHEACKRYVTGINCCTDTAFAEMLMIKKKYEKEDKILAFHAIQSFKPGEVTADMAHEIGVKLAERMWGDRFQVVVTTHLDREHIHNHFVINSVSFLDGKKYYSNKSTYALQKQISDELCFDYGLSVIGNTNHKGTNRGAYRAEQNGRYTIEKIVKEDIDRFIEEAGSLSDFLHKMQKSGYRINNEGKYLKIYPYGHSKPIRIDRRFPGYDMDGIVDMISQNNVIIKHRKLKAGNTKRPYYRYTGYKAKYVRILFMLGRVPVNKRQYKNTHYLMREELIELGTLRNEMNFMINNHIKTESDLVYVKSQINNTLDAYIKERQHLRNKLRRAKGDDIEILKSEIFKYNSDIKTLKKYEYYCNDIKIRSEKYNRKMDMIKEEEMTYEYRSERD